MESKSADPSSGPQGQASDVQPPLSISGQNNSAHESASLLSSSTSGISSWARRLKAAQVREHQEDPQSGNASKLNFAQFTSGLGLHFPPAAPVENGAEASSTAAQVGVFESLTKGLVDTSRSAVKAVQVKARHIVSQNKRRYQDGGFDLDMTYITENIIAMGFPAGDLSSGIFGYVEGFYRNNMDEVIRFFETHHKGKYKVYNLCSERLYDASLFQGKAASFPFDDHNCPPLHLISSFCQSAYSWLKEDIENVVVVHCKAGMGRTGLMISSLLLYLKFCPTAEESIDCFNQKRCIDGKGLVLPSQIRYVRYFERILRDHIGENQPGRRCMLRGFRLAGCPYWIRPSITISDHRGVLFATKKHPKTKDLMPEDFWINTSKKGIVVFALPGEPGLAEVKGDFKIDFHDRHGDFYCWLNTAMIENRLILSTDDLDGFDKRKLPSPRFQVEIVMIDYNGVIPKGSNADPSSKKSNGRLGRTPTCNNEGAATSSQNGRSESDGKDDVFSDSDGEGDESSNVKQFQTPANEHVTNLTHEANKLSIRDKEPTLSKNSDSGSAAPNSPGLNSSGLTDFKAIAADASVFSFGDEDYESE
ncbi:Phosphatidylinositol 3,4,5-trisphosphate 3-phosphatase and protein-tyrosine-phosphatase pten2a, variant 2 [Ancistrocladus abbreviatus]